MLLKLCQVMSTNLLEQEHERDAPALLSNIQCYHHSRQLNSERKQMPNRVNTEDINICRSF